MSGLQKGQSGSKSGGRVRRKILCSLGSIAGVLVLVGSMSTAASGSTSAVRATRTVALSGSPVQFEIFDLVGIGIGTASQWEQDGNAVQKIINASGGIKGRPIQITECQTSTTEAQADECAVQAADNPSVVGILEPDTEFGSTIMPILQKAGLIALGTATQTAADFQNPISYPFFPGGPGVVGGDAAICTETLKSKNVGLAYADVAAGLSVAQAGDASILEPQHVKVTQVPIPLTAPNLDAQVQKLDTTGCVVSATGESSSLLEYKGLQALGYKGGFAESTGTLADTEAALPKDSKDFFAIFPWDSASAGYKSFVKQMAANGDPSVVNSDPSVYLAAKLAQSILDAAPSVNRKALLDGVQKTTNYMADGMVSHPVNFSLHLPKPYNRLFNPYEFPHLYTGSGWKVLPAVNSLYPPKK